ncbi:BREX system serine/threonine kinase PglW [Kocuria sp. CPCC 205268]|uniref:BREX system serine/threonine kinase PglW n=1 Tax=Kocuria oxytropis TaxID=3058913 RepID=UPI0034D5896C
MADERWTEVSPSEFEHEAQGLAYLRERLPDEMPYRAWTNFEFRDSLGRWHEVDAMILTRNTLHIVELKYYSGTITGTDTRWRRDNGDRSRSEDSPLMLAQKKARVFASRLKDEFADWAAKKGVDHRAFMRQIVPYVKAEVFLHHPHVRVDLSEESKQNLWGLDATENVSGLRGISSLILEEPHNGTPIGRNQEEILAELIERVGVQRRERQYGSWTLHASEVLGQGPDWLDLAASHSAVQDRQARIRIHLTPEGASKEDVRRRRQLAEHEFRLMSRLSHDGLMRPVDLLETDMGVGLVYDYDKDYQRLDLWMADQVNGATLEDQLEIIRQAAETLDYAHRNAVVHRGLWPQAVWVKRERNRLSVKLSDWQTAGSASADAAETGVTSLVRSEATVFGGTDDDGSRADVYRAPEGRWIGPSTDRMGLDVFSLGALAFYILTGRSPAESPLDLAEKLREQGGLDAAALVPQLGSNIRDAVRSATRPRPSDRTPAVRDFLDQLERPDVDETVVDDPLEATAGTVLAGGRFVVQRRLGKGSTAVGMQVEERSGEEPVVRVLKLALDDKAAARLEDEAQVMADLPRSPRLVARVEGPIDVDGRQALLLESAGPQTLTELLRERRGRLSLDLTERFGNDLLQAVELLDKAGIVHRDIKPSNLGVRADSNKSKHLVLFDFSASRADPGNLEIGTAPYLDPFLGKDRPQFDSAAERYAVAVVLFEMATGRTPYYGDDPYAAPTVVDDDVTIRPGELDPSVEEPLGEFFRRALARSIEDRFDTVQDMRAAWQRVFTGQPTTAPEDADELAEQAELDTPLTEAGLSARGLSALEPFRVTTVGDLLAVDAVRLNHLSGVAEPTRREVKGRANAWRRRFGEQVVLDTDRSGLPTLTHTADLLRGVLTSTRTTSGVEAVDLVLGRTGSLDAFATQAELGGSMAKPITSAGTSLLLDRLQDTWAKHDDSLRLLRALERVVDARLDELGQVATPEELADAIRAASSVGSEKPAEARRLAHGLLRIVVDRRRAQLRGEQDAQPLEIRRREKRVLAIARDTRLLDRADSLGAEADALVRRLAAEDDLVPAERVLEGLQKHWQDDDPPALWDGLRPVRLAAQLSAAAAATSIGELYARDLPAHRAVALVLGGMGVRELHTPKEIHDRVRTRFPSFGSLPNRPGLDSVLRDAGVELIFDETRKAYVSPTVRGDTTGLYTQVPTYVADTAEDLSAGALTQRLKDSIDRRSYLVLGTRPDRMDKLQRILQDQFGGQVLDVTSLLLDELHRMADEGEVPPWTSLVAADAQPQTARPRKGLQVVVDRAIPAVIDRLHEAMNDADRPGPVVLTETSPLVRYGHGAVLRRLSDLTERRERAVWVLVPQFASHVGAMVDGESVQTSPQQFIPVDSVWIDPRAAQLLEPGDPRGAHA